MTAPSVMAPGTPSTRPGLKPKDRSRAWTSLASSRCTGVWFGAGSTGAGWPSVAGAGSVPTAGKGRAEARLAGGGGDDAADSVGAGAGWLSAAGAACAAAGTTAGVSATLAAGDGDEGAGEGDAESSGAGAGAAAVLSRGDSGSGRAAALGD